LAAAEAKVVDGRGGAGVVDKEPVVEGAGESTDGLAVGVLAPKDAKAPEPRPKAEVGDAIEVKDALVFKGLMVLNGLNLPP